jgi:G6PDH family F420-dependent oxidoreductase
VLGDHWPEHPVRLEMLDEAVEVIRKLWEGGQTSHHGTHYDVQNARLFTLPDELPPIAVSAYGERTARAAAEFGDGFWAVGPQDTVEVWEDNGGEGPRFCQLTGCVAGSEDEAVETVYEWWPQTGLPGELSSQLPTPTHFEQAVEVVEPEDVREGSAITDQDPDTHIENIQTAVDAGYDHVYFHQVGPDQEACFEFYESEVLPSF